MSSFWIAKNPFTILSFLNLLLAFFSVFRHVLRFCVRVVLLLRLTVDVIDFVARLLFYLFQTAKTDFFLLHSLIAFHSSCSSFSYGIVPLTFYLFPISSASFFYNSSPVVIRFSIRPLHILRDPICLDTRPSFWLKVNIINFLPVIIFVILPFRNIFVQLMLIMPDC